MINFQDKLKALKEKRPKVHCITNYVTANDCANMLLAIGASPIMADAKEEVEEVTGICDALVLNAGTLKAESIPSMIISARKANQMGIPIILDPVGIGVSEFRTNHIYNIINEAKISVIRGNATEIMSFVTQKKNSSGIDVSREEEVHESSLDLTVLAAKKLRKLTSAVIVITGKIDVIVSEKIIYLPNGHDMMSRITGTGCMLTAAMAAFLAANNEEVDISCALAVGLYGLAGEIAYQRMIPKTDGTGTFRRYFMDAMSNLSEDMIGGIRFEVH